MTFNKCLKYNHPTKPLMLICVALYFFSVLIFFFHTSGKRFSHALIVTAKTSLRNKLFLYVQNLHRVEIFHTPGARLGNMLMFYLQETTDL